MSCIVFAHPTVGMSNYLATNPDISVYLNHVNFGKINMDNFSSRKHQSYVRTVRYMLGQNKVIFIPFRIDLITLMLENGLSFNICMPTDTPKNKLDVLVRMVDEQTATKTIEAINSSWDVIQRNVTSLDKSMEQINVWYVDSNQNVSFPLAPITTIFKNINSILRDRGKSDDERNHFAI